jgi:hypothetical protein
MEPLLENVVLDPSTSSSDINSGESSLKGVLIGFIFVAVP